MSTAIPSGSHAPMQIGRYRHYKGKDYVVIGVARHSETEEELVVYRTDYGERSLWVRPRAMFEETVAVDGKRVPRFRYVGPAPPDSPPVASNAPATESGRQ